MNLLRRHLMNPDYLQRKRDEAIRVAHRWLADGLLIFDTETTGTKNNSEIVEIAVIDDSNRELLNTLVKPMYDIPNGATRIHGIDHRMVIDAPIWPNVYESLCELVNSQLLVAYNLEFDVRMVHQSSALHNFIPKVKVRGGCAMKLFAQFYGEWNHRHNNFRWSKLSDAARICGVDVRNTHRALGDCKMTLGVIRHIASHA